MAIQGNKTFDNKIGLFNLRIINANQMMCCLWMFCYTLTYLPRRNIRPNSSQNPVNWENANWENANSEKANF